MLTFDQAFIEAIHIINHKLKHSGYDRTVELAEKYWRLNTGEETEKLLKRFHRRESKEAFDQRCTLTSTITPAVLSTLNSPFYKAGRSDNVTKVIKYEKEDDAREKQLKDFLETFNGTSSLDDYLSVDLVDLNKSDPNAFVVIDFMDFDPNTEVPKPYPVEIPSKNVYNFHYQNKSLEFLLTNEEINAGNQKSKFTLQRFTLYAREWHARFTEVEKGSIQSVVSENVVDFNSDGTLEIIERPEYLRTDHNTVYRIEYLNHTFEKVPAFRAGYEPDLATQKQTMVSNWHCTMPWFDKMQQAGSELDLSVALHVFPQKISYERGCPGYEGMACIDGKDINGNTCKRCNGTGFIDDHTSSQDVIKFRLPNTKKGEEFFDLSKLVAYITPDIGIIQWLDEYVNKLEAKTRHTLFNSQSFDRNEVVATATEKTLDLENVYDTLFPFCKHLSFAWMLIVEATAKFTDLSEGLEVNHEFGNDLKFKTESQYIQDIKTLSESNAPHFLKQHTHNQLAELIYKDNELELLKIKTKGRFTPFAGKTDSEIIFILSGNNVPRRRKVLYENIDEIFASFEADFYMMDYERQKEQVELKVKEIIEEIDSQITQADTVVLDDDATGEGN